MKRFALLAAMVLQAACGLGFVKNPTVAITAPWHDHQSDIENFPAIPSGAPAPAAPAGVTATIVPVLRYYPQPIGFRYGTAQGAATSFGHTEVLSYAPVEPPVPVEAQLSTLLQQAIPAGPAVRLSGVVEEAEWYEFEFDSGGRITTRMTVERADGSVAFEGRLTTTGRGRRVDDLVRAHLAEWFRKPEFVAALAGGAR